MILYICDTDNDNNGEKFNPVKVQTHTIVLKAISEKKNQWFHVDDNRHSNSHQVD